MYDRKTTQATIELLAERFPACFADFQGRRKPLKVGIRDDVMATLAITAKDLSAAMRLYCSNDHYLKSCIEGAPRIDLNGEPCGSVNAKGGPAQGAHRTGPNHDKGKKAKPCHG